jgi:hypothetical protein
MGNKTFSTSETQTESKEKRSSGEQQLQEQQQQETRELALRCLLHAAGTSEDERERGARAPGGPEERGVPVSLSPVRPVARGGQSLLI